MIISLWIYPQLQCGLFILSSFRAWLVVPYLIRQFLILIKFTFCLIQHLPVLVKTSILTL